MDPNLYTSVKIGDIQLLRRLLNENPSGILKLTPQGNTLLHIAARFGQHKIVSEICSRQWSLLIHPNLDGDMPLHLAAQGGQFKILHILLNEILSSRQINIESGKGGGIETLRLGNNANDTVLHEAVRNHHFKLVQLLLNTDPELACLVNNVGESPLYLAARDGMPEIVDVIFSVVPSAAHAGSNGQTALHAAVNQSNLYIINRLLMVKPELTKETDQQGRTPLHYAAHLGDLRIVRKLLELDYASSYTLDEHGESPIHIASSRDHTKVIRKIIQQCPDSGELVNLMGRNVLHVAVLNGNVNTVRYILETTELEGLINQSDCDGNTPLHLAVKLRKIWIVFHLMWDKRVDRNIENNAGQTALDIDESIRERCKSIFRVSGMQRKIVMPSKLNVKEKFNQEPTETTMHIHYGQMGRTLLVVATLIATVTFAAAFTVPGGYNNDGSEQGLAVLRTSNHLRWFVVTDAVAMTSSMTAICVMIWGAAFGAGKSYVYYFASATMLTYLAILSAASAFNTALTSVMPNQQFVYSLTYIIAFFFHINTFLLVFYMMKILCIAEVYRFFMHCVFKPKFRLIYARMKKSS